MSSLSCSSGIKLSQHTHTSSPTGTKLSQHTHTSSTTGTKLSQHAQNCPFQPVLPEQGELCTAATTKKSSRENFLPHPAPPPIQNSPNTPTPAAQPVQNSPNTPKRSSPVEWCNRFVSFGLGYALSWSGVSSCWVGWGVSRDLVRMSRLR